MNYFHSQHFFDNREFTPPLKSCTPKAPANLIFSKKYSSSTAGFSLIEMLVVVAIIAFLSASLILNFSRTRIDIEQSANLIMATIREAQSKTVSSTVYNGYNPCGYGIHYVSSNQLAIYVGPNAASPTNCLTINKNYQIGEDAVIKTQTFTDLQVEIKNSFNDIFFLPPDPKTYLNNNASLNQSPITIQIGPVGGTCPTNCRTISIYPSGKIESQ